MIKLITLLKEVVSNSKAIIMAGAAGAGKTRVVNTFKGDAKDWAYINMDKYVRDPNSPLYKNPYQANKATEAELNTTLTAPDHPNFIWDTTALNVEKVSKVPEAGYNVLMIMVYTHPIVAFYQNFKRAKEEGEESLPSKAILETWAKIYQPELIKKYQSMFGENFLLVNNTPETNSKIEELIKNFNDAAQKSPEAIKQFIDSELKKEPEFYTVSMKKEKEPIPSNVETDFNEKIKGLGSLTSYETRKLKEKAAEYYAKNNEFMPLNKKGRSNGFVENLASIRKQIEKIQEEEKQLYIDIYNLFKNIAPSDITVKEATNRAKQFIQS